MDHLQAHLRQIRTTLDATRAIAIISPDNVHMQISNGMSAERRDIYTGTVLERVSLVDNKARIPRHTHSNRPIATDPQQSTHSDRPTATNPQRPTYSDRPTATDPQQPIHNNQPSATGPQRPAHKNQSTATDRLVRPRASIQQ